MNCKKIKSIQFQKEKKNILWLKSQSNDISLPPLPIQVVTMQQTKLKKLNILMKGD